MKLTDIAIRNIKRNKKRSILSFTATALATFAIVFMFSFLGGFGKDIRDVAFNYNTGEVLIRHIDFDEKSFSLDRAVDNYKEVLKILERDYESLSFSPRINFPSTVLDDDKSYISFGVAVDFSNEESYLNLSDKIIKGKMPTKPKEVIMGHGLAKELNLDIGDKFTPITTTRKGASTGITFQVAALGKFEDPAFSNKTFIVSLDKLSEMLRMKGAISDILVKGVGDRKINRTVRRMNTTLGVYGFNTIRAYSWKDVGVSFSFYQMADFTYTIVGILFFFLASTVIANTMLMAVFERRREIGTITSLGMTDLEVIRLFFLEAFFLGVIGAGIGVVVGSLLVLPLSIIGLDLTSMAAGVEMGASFHIFPQLSIKSTLLVFIYSVFIASFVSFFPSQSAAKVDPVVALRSE